MGPVVFNLHASKLIQKEKDKEQKRLTNDGSVGGTEAAVSIGTVAGEVDSHRIHCARVLGPSRHLTAQTEIPFFVHCLPAICVFKT